VKLLLLLLAVIGFAGYILPGRLEITATPCTALDARAGRLLDAGLAKPLPRSPGALGTALGEVIHSHFPFLPGEIACAAAFWMTVYQPDLTRLAPGLAPPKG
jgi:hypothetical protein